MTVKKRFVKCDGETYTVWGHGEVTRIDGLGVIKGGANIKDIRSFIRSKLRGTRP